LGEQDELQKAHPRGVFPLKVAEDDDLVEGLDVLVYLTLWMSIKSNRRAPEHLESRIVLSGTLKGPWKQLYVKLCMKWNQGIKVDEIWDLAS
jgi:hypothetical protein